MEMHRNGEGTPEHCFPIAITGTLAVSHPFLTQVYEHADIKGLVLDLD